MTQNALVLTGLIQQLVGQRCERVDNPHGSILRLDIGQLGTLPDDPPDALSHGWRHLTVLSPWRLQDKDYVACDSTDPGGAGGVIASYVTILNGRKIVSASVTEPAFDLEIEFKGGLNLVVFSNNGGVDDSAWFILGTDGLQVSAKPRRRDSGGWRMRDPSIDKVDGSDVV